MKRIAVGISISGIKQRDILQNLRKEVKVESRAEEKLAKASHILDEHFTCSMEELDMKPLQDVKEKKDEEVDDAVRHWFCLHLKIKYFLPT